MNLPRPAATAPWSYIKIAEGCDRNCGFCAIPSFRGKQRSRSAESILAEVDQLGGPDRSLAGGGPGGPGPLVVRPRPLDRQDRAPPRRPGRRGRRPIVDLVAAVAERVRWTRLLYLYPSTLDDALVEAILATGVPYFDLSLQHVSRPLLKRMRRWGEGDRFLERIGSIRPAEPTAAFRSSFIIGYPGETEADHDHLLEWIAEAQLDWVGFFPFSNEAGTYASGLDDQVPDELVAERLRECTELQDAITAGRREALIGADRRGAGRRTGRGADLPGGPGDRRDRHACPTTSRWDRSSTWWSPAPTAPTWWPSSPARRAPATRPARPGRVGSGPMSDGAVNPGAPASPASVTRRHHLRAVGPADPGQRHHRAPAAGHAGGDRPDHAVGGQLVHLRLRRAAGPVRRHRRVAGPHARGPPGRVPSSIRWPTRSWCSAPCSPWWPRGSSGGCRWPSSPSARWP